jgi:signal transduction histidine kinase
VDAGGLAELTLQQLQAELGTADATLFVATEGEDGTTLLQSLATLGEAGTSEAFTVARMSPVLQHLHQQPATALSRYELEVLPAFAVLPASEKANLLRGQTALLVPLQAGSYLVGIMALGQKTSGEPYSSRDLARLHALANRSGPLLHQARQIAVLEKLQKRISAELGRRTDESQQLAELLNLHEQFVRTISPTLRQPLGEMYMALEQLAQTANGDLGDGALQQLDRQLSRLRLMINNLIRTADRVQKQRGFVRETVRVDEIVDRAVHNLATMAAARHVTINVSIAPDLPLIVGDDERLTEAVQHLLHNAIKFNKIGGTVAIEAELDQEEMQIHVRDSGVGMSAAQLEQIWQGFRALPEAEDRLSPGLGLMLTRFIARAHGGHISVESKYGTGTVFCLHLPLARQRVLPATTAPAP